MEQNLPLNKQSLINRYKEIYLLAAKGLSSIMIGPGKSAKSGYLKHILHEDLEKQLFGQNNITTLLIDPFINIESTPIDLMIDSLKKHMKSSAVEEIDDLKTLAADSYKERKKYLLFLTRPNYWHSLDERDVLIFKSILEFNKIPPHNPFMFCFQSDPSSVEVDSHFYRNILTSYPSTVIYFPVLDTSEFEYTAKRLSNHYDLTTQNLNIQSLYEYTGGIYPLLKVILSTSEKSKKITSRYLSNIYEHPAIQFQLDYQVRSFSSSQLKQLKNTKSIDRQSDLINLGIVDKDKKIQSKWLSKHISSYNPSRASESVLNLTKTEKAIFNKMEENIGNVLTRDEIAQAIWGEDYINSYSEWAIDKQISRLREKILKSNSDYFIVTHKGLGHELAKLRN